MCDQNATNRTPSRRKLLIVNRKPLVSGGLPIRCLVSRNASRLAHQALPRTWCADQAQDLSCESSAVIFASRSVYSSYGSHF